MDIRELYDLVTGGAMTYKSFNLWIQYFMDADFQRGMKEGHDSGYELGYRDGRGETIMDKPYEVIKFSIPQEFHICPYASEINDDYSECNCTPEEVEECCGAI